MSSKNFRIAQQIIYALKGAQALSGETGTRLSDFVQNFSGERIEPEDCERAIRYLEHINAVEEFQRKTMTTYDALSKRAGE